MTTPQLTDDELRDLAHSAYEEAMSFGLSVDTFLRYFKGIRNRLATQAQGQDAAPAEQPCHCPACLRGEDAPHEYHLEQRPKGKK